MGYIRLIPSIVDYTQKFGQLDSLDFKIVGAVCKHGVLNLSSLADIVGVPEQTISYHVKRFESHDLVRFRALVDEAKLGLKSYSVIVSTPPGGEGISSRSMTCFPLWRYLATVDGWNHGNYVRYAIPPNKETDLKAFLNELGTRKLVSDFEIMPTTSPNYPFLNLDFYHKKKDTPVFDWDKWVRDYDSFPEKEINEPDSYKKVKFDLYDLIILRCLEINAMTTQREIAGEMARILGDKEHKKLIPLVSRRMRDNIKRQDLIRGYRAYLFPNSGPTALFLMLHLVFPNSSSMKKYAAGLALLPYNTSYEKILKRDALFVRFIIPTHEWPNMRRSLAQLGEKGHLKDIRLFFGDLTYATWDNVEIHQMFKDGAWNFSYGAAIEMLENNLRTHDKKHRH